MGRGSGKMKMLLTTTLDGHRLDAGPSGEKLGARARVQQFASTTNLNGLP